MQWCTYFSLKIHPYQQTNLVVQKYLPAKINKGALKYAPFYHDLSSPVSNSTVNDWDNELYISGIGNYDGIGGPAGVDGWDYNNTPSMYTYVTSSNTFSAVTGSSTALTPGKGYNMLLLDRYISTNDSGTFNSIISSWGKRNK